MERTRLALQRGVSLVESAVTLGVVAGALRLGLPPMQDFVLAARLSSATEALVGDLHLARSEALKRNQHVAICKSVEGARCSSVGGWEQGWIVFHDLNNNGQYDTGEEMIRRHEALAREMRVSGNQPVEAYISYTGLGVTRSKSGAIQAGTLTICRLSAAATQARQVIVNAGGRPRSQRATVATCDA